jgi:hypothetical protein
LKNSLSGAAENPQKEFPFLKKGFHSSLSAFAPNAAQ